MKSINKLQAFILILALGLFVLLFFANKKQVKKAEEVVGNVSNLNNDSASSRLIFFMEAKKSVLPDSLKEKLAVLEKTYANQPQSESAIDSLIEFWDRLMIPTPSTFYTEKKAMMANSPGAWFKTGDRFYYAVRFVKDPAEVQMLFQKAISAYQKGLNLDGSNVDAQIQLASCLVEGTADPMKGIAMLRDLEKKDSTNAKIQLVLAAFAVKSGQLDKAIQRYEKVIRLKPDFLETYLYLADAWEKKGDVPQTIKALEQYVALTPDPVAKAEVKKYINQLKN